jgi:predicted kinase
MSNAVLIFGAPGSGKSTMGEDYRKLGFKELNRDNIRFGVVQPGGDWTTWKFNSIERLVTKIWDSAYEFYRDKCYDIVITDTNCKKGNRDALVRRLERDGYEVLQVRLNPPLEVLLERDQKRGKMSVGEGIITQMYENLNKEI